MIKFEVIGQNIKFLERLGTGNILYVEVPGDLRAKNSKNPWFSRDFCPLGGAGEDALRRGGGEEGGEAQEGQEERAAARQEGGARTTRREGVLPGGIRDVGGVHFAVQHTFKKTQ